jgi:hypothetical protein
MASSAELSPSSRAGEIEFTDIRPYKKEPLETSVVSPEAPVIDILSKRVLPEAWIVNQRHASQKKIYDVLLRQGKLPLDFPAHMSPADLHNDIAALWQYTEIYQTYIDAYFLDIPVRSPEARSDRMDRINVAATETLEERGITLNEARNEVLNIPAGPHPDTPQLVIGKINNEVIVRPKDTTEGGKYEDGFYPIKLADLAIMNTELYQGPASRRYS